MLVMVNILMNSLLGIFNINVDNVLNLCFSVEYLIIVLLKKMVVVM